MSLKKKILSSAYYETPRNNYYADAPRSRIKSAAVLIADIMARQEAMHDHQMHVAITGALRTAMLRKRRIDFGMHDIPFDIPGSVQSVRSRFQGRPQPTVRNSKLSDWLVPRKFRRNRGRSKKHTFSKSKGRFRRRS
jgi:hypothetical protein